MPLRFVAFPANIQGGGQVATQACFGASEGAVHRGERGVELVGHVRVAEHTTRQLPRQQARCVSFRAMYGRSLPPGS